MPKGKNAKTKTVTAKSTSKVNTALKLQELDEFDKPIYQRCKYCNKIKKIDKFQVSHSPTDKKTGHISICKDCLSFLSLDNDGKFNKKKVYELCELLDKPFINSVFDQVQVQMNSAKTSQLQEKSKMAVYINVINSLKNGYKDKTFKDSDKIIKEKHIAENEKEDTKNKNIEDIIFWGEGWTDIEYKQLNLLYEDYSNNYKTVTAMHKRALIKVCQCELRYTNALALNDSASTKKYGDLLDKLQKAAKINPNQLSQADLSEGMTCFSQLSLAVEKEVDIIKTLPKYKENPLDRVDYNIYMYIDYLRSLEGKSHIEYKDIWKFLKENYSKNKKKYGENVVPDERKISEDVILVEE